MAGNDDLHPIDQWLPLRKAWVAHLLATSAITDIVGQKIFGGQPTPLPSKPFIRIGPQISAPFSGYGWRGSAHRLTTHCFASGPFSDQAAQIAAAVVASANDFYIASLDIVDLQWAGTNTIPDSGSPSDWHAIVDFAITTVLSV